MADLVVHVHAGKVDLPALRVRLARRQDAAAGRRGSGGCKNRDAGGSDRVWCDTQSPDPGWLNATDGGILQRLRRGSREAARGRCPTRHTERGKVLLSCASRMRNPRPR